MRILLIDHEAESLQSMRLRLEQQGYSVDGAGTTAAAEEAAAVLLVVRQPGADGSRACRELRRLKVATPILLLSTGHAPGAAVAGLDAGADDHLAAPYAMDELLARLRSLLRRSQASQGALLVSGDLEMNLHEHRVVLAGAQVKLSAKEFALLEFMMRNPRRLLTRTMISESVWDMNYDAHSNVVDVYVSSLRRKIDRDPARRRIETVIGCGYRFVDPDDVSETARASRAT
jgi:DNA-binding response OmpR family regulator